MTILRVGGAAARVRVHRPDARGAEPSAVRVASPDGECGPACACTPCSARQAAVVTTGPFADVFPVPEYPPVEWFAGPPTWVDAWRLEHGYPPAIEQDGLIRRLTITDEGRIGGYFYVKGVCHVDASVTMQPGAADCFMPDDSPTGYLRFMQADEVVADGTIIRAGAIGNTGGHVNPYLAASVSSKRYADPRVQMLVCRAGDDDYGGWIAGAVVPGTTYGDVALMRRSTLSGDWRWFNADEVQPQAGYDCLGPTIVTRAGLAAPMHLVRVASASDPEHPDYLTPGGPNLPVLDDSPKVTPLTATIRGTGHYRVRTGG